ncbi:MAG: DUF6713 family protein [Cyanobacteria bacterium P01_A01_bin.105]
MKGIAFYLGLGCLFTHELDATLNHEWRVLPLLRALPDEVGRSWFIALHVPLFAVIVAWVAHTQPRTRLAVRVILSLFLVVHALLHWLLSGDANYEFASRLSHGLIYGGAVFGGVFLLLWAFDVRERFHDSRV